MIKDRLTATGEETDEDSPADRGGRRPLSRRELLEAAGIEDSYLTELEDFGLVQRSGRHYGPEALEAVRIIAALGRYGVQARHLRAVRAAVERESSLIEQVVAPTLRQRSPGSRDRAGQTAGEIAALSLQLHAALLTSALADAGFEPAEPPASAPAPASPPAAAYGDPGFAGPAAARSGA